MLHVRDVTHFFGDLKVLDRVSFTVNRGDRIGLIGPNGCGKTTLLRILAGELAPDRGAVVCTSPGIRSGYLPQGLAPDEDATVGSLLPLGAAPLGAAPLARRADGPDAAEGLAAEGLAAAEARLARLGEAIAAARGRELEEALAAYEEALAEMAEPEAEATAGAVLAGLGMPDVALDRPVRTLSGGQKTRLGLARLLLSKPDLLLLDEPTNHLDIAALEWLEGFLAGYSGAVLVVSHDRTFLDRTVTQILALDGEAHTLRAFAGNYSDYAAASDRALEKQWAEYHEQQERVARLESSIRRLSNQAHGIEQETIHFHYRRIAKDLARRAVVQKARLERMLADEERVEKPSLAWKMKLEFAAAPRSGQDVLHVTELRAGYGGRAVLDGANMHLAYGERAVLIGPNGAGKTTLLRVIMGQLAPLAGEARLGRGVRAGYMAQEQETLDPGETPYGLVRRAAPLAETEARSFLHYFLFAGDEVFQPVGSLSYGERSRLALALLAAGGCNLLLLDEPLNHLDIPARERFEQAIARFEGTVLAVVHDRTFIERIATSVWTLEDGALRRASAGEG